MFRYSTILRERVQSLAKFTRLLKHSVKLRRILYGDVAACREMACVLSVVQVSLLMLTVFWRHSQQNPHFREPERSLPHSKQPTTYPYPEPDQSSSRPPNRFP